MTILEFNPDGVTGNGIPSDMFYKEEYTGPQGARITLLKEEHHYSTDVEYAKKWLKDNLDVVKIYIINE